VEAQDISGARVVKSVFAETAIPVLPTLEVGLAGRYDDYNDFGTTVNPKASMQFRPLDTLLLRASYGTGFKAPEMSVLYDPPVNGWNWVIDSWRCSQTPEDVDGDGRANVDESELSQSHPCVEQRYFSVWSGNPDLDPEESDNWTAGLVFSPTTDLSMVLDYYNIELHEMIWNEKTQSKLDEEFALRQAGETGSTVGRVTRATSGRIERLYYTYENIETVKTDGLDAEIRYAFSAGRVGDFTTTLRWTHVLSYEADYAREGEGLQDWVGYVGHPQDRGQLTLNWNLGDYEATIVGNYISDQDGHVWDEDNDHVASFTTWDVQASYSAPWNGQFTVGARNVLDRYPPQANTGQGYDMTQHEIYGRVPYLRLEQDF
jgi:iron complex outermembrane receptor protein